MLWGLEAVSRVTSLVRLVDLIVRCHLSFPYFLAAGTCLPEPGKPKPESVRIMTGASLAPPYCDIPAIRPLGVSVCRDGVRYPSPVFEVLHSSCKRAISATLHFHMKVRKIDAMPLLPFCGGLSRRGVVRNRGMSRIATL